MCKDVDDICRNIDSLLINSLELMEEKVSLNMQLEKLLRDGHIELAKAKYIRGKESVSILQIPNGIEANTLFQLESKTSEDDDVDFDVSLKKFQDEKDHSEDPIKWFGVLVPQNLRNAQKRFQESVYLAVNVANVQNRLNSVTKKLKDLYSLKAVENDE